ncbi:GGDEF domain-containing protein [Rhizobium sp. PAMB 3182]
MENLLNIATMMICTSIITVFVAIGFSMHAIFRPQEPAVRWWAATMWLGTGAMILLASRSFWPFWLTVGFGNALTVAAYGFLLSGFRVFFGKTSKWPLALIGMLIWLGSLAGFDWIRTDVNNRIMLMALLMSGYTLPIAFECWKGWKREGLPTALVCSLFFLTHAVTYLVRIPLAYIRPADEYLGTAWSPWFAFLTLEAFIHVLFTTIAIIVLVKERAEAKYRRAAETDSLTGAPNRGYFVRRVERHLAGKPQPFVFALMDLDNFKAINDQYGHLAGDAVLKGFAELLMAHLPPSSMFGRIGGEEFAMLIGGLTEQDALEVLETIRRETERLDQSCMAGVPAVTVSIGAVASTSGLMAFDGLAAAADLALYSAKGQGRNRLCVYQPALMLRAAGEVDGAPVKPGRTPAIRRDRLVETS